MKLILKLVRKLDLVGKLLPLLLRAWAEGGLGEPARRVYWKLAEYKTISGALLMAVGTGLEALASSYPDWTWAPGAAGAVFWLGAILSSVGLIDAGVRSPWPSPPEGGRPWERHEDAPPV